eukprot:scaffold173633_cov27-Tisochrysis_lutea.AAC.3
MPMAAPPSAEATGPRRMMIRDERVQHEEEVGVSEANEGEEETVGRNVVDVVQVMLIRLLIGRLVLSDRVDERVPCARVLNKERPHTRRQGAEVARRIQECRDEYEDTGSRRRDLETE